MAWLIILLIVFAAGAIFLYVLLRATNVPKSVYSSRVIYNDHKERIVQPLFSSSYGLAGKPDFILHTKDGLLPLEIKSAKRPDKPYFSHVMQLVSYCLLIEEERNFKPRYGFLQYQGGRPFYIPYTEKHRTFLINTINDMRRCMESKDIPLLAHSKQCRYQYKGTEA